MTPEYKMTAKERLTPEEKMTLKGSMTPEDKMTLKGNITPESKMTLKGNMTPKEKMTPKERMYAVIEGEKPDVWPVATPYTMLSNADHWVELTGLPVYKYYEWQRTADMDWHRQIYKIMYERQAFDAVEPDYGPPYAQRQKKEVEIVRRGGKAYFHFKKGDKYEPVPDNIHNAASGGGENETRHIYSKSDARERLKVTKAEHMLADGCNCSLDELIGLYGDTRFVINGGVVNTFYSNAYHVGMTNLYAMLCEEPELIKYISELTLEQNIERIRAYAAAGGDAIFIDDATATNDMISRRMYEEFSFPYLPPQIKEIQRLGKKAILTYFGGIADRADVIADAGADVLIMECSMKSYVNDYAEIAPKLKGMCLAGNLNPYDDIEITSDGELARRVEIMSDAGRRHGKYYTSTGSPITPNTTLERIQRYIALAHRPA